MVPTAPDARHSCALTAPSARSLKLAYVYFEEEQGRRSAEKLLTAFEGACSGPALSTTERKRLRANVHTCGRSCRCHKRLRLQQQPRPRSTLVDLLAD